MESNANLLRIELIESHVDYSRSVHAKEVVARIIEAVRKDGASETDDIVSDIFLNQEV